MSPTFSIYLDAIRFLAALTVFLAHAQAPHRGALQLGGFPAWRLANDAVVTFFVLSGLVIHYSVDHRDCEIATYIINRLARLWSVVIPALLLTILLYTAGSALAPRHYAEYASTAPVTSILGSAFFVHQLWFLELSPPSDAPFWSLGFEAWYYIIFGCAFFFRGWTRLAAVGLAAAAMGPKVLILLPVWLLGAAVYRVRIVTASDRLGAALFFGSVAAYLLYQWSGLSRTLWAGVLGFREELGLGMAGAFLSDYIVALLIVANFIGFRILERRWAPVFAVLEKPIRFLASYTFSLYLFHFPLLIFTTSFLPDGSYLLLPIVLAAIVGLGSITERRKDVVRKLLWRLSAAGAAICSGRQVKDDAPAPYGIGTDLRKVSDPAGSRQGSPALR